MSGVRTVHLSGRKVAQILSEQGEEAGYFSTRPSQKFEVLIYEAPLAEYEAATSDSVPVRDTDERDTRPVFHMYREYLPAFLNSLGVDSSHALDDQWINDNLRCTTWRSRIFLIAGGNRINLGVIRFVDPMNPDLGEQVPAWLDIDHDIRWLDSESQQGIV